MGDRDYHEQEDIFSKVVRAGRRTYFFDVRSTKADDYYLTITESKKFTNDDGSFHFKKHKIYLYKEDFAEFGETLKEVTDFILEKRGNEVISDKHQSDFSKNGQESAGDKAAEPNHPASFTNVEFDDM
ncbi:DNA-binding protein [Nonlabens spongiae]|uniref:DNA-binding protein n=1 Tax=Nonlabens spongiae TaxID=331648 RepID=A0A1W6MGJ2_9FLAO|nr:PUR family DNA/RNA-binding protein [Nonlabens spongiae]ARN76715.1 DNA-binding protein [Nonlabens spongiae]